jgi:hypothetical protein
MSIKSVGFEQDNKMIQLVKSRWQNTGNNFVPETLSQ